MKGDSIQGATQAIFQSLEKNAGEYADIIEYGAGAYLSIIGAILVFIAGLISSATKSEIYT